MKIKIVILATVCSLLSSCGSDLPTTRNIKPYIVKSIDGHNDKLCKYNLETGADYVSYDDNITVVDSIGKWVIGDSLIITLNKR